MALRAYLAGPDVFLRDAAEILSRKADIARSAGLVPVVPGDAEVPRGATRFDWGLAISRADERMMDESDIIVANLTPFRGVGADAGTVFELGYMSARGKPAFGYSNSTSSYFERHAAFYCGRVERLSEERWSTPDETYVEDFGMAENLMIEGGIVARGGVFVRRDVAPAALWTDLGAFEACIAAAVARVGAGSDKLPDRPQMPAAGPMVRCAGTVVIGREPSNGWP